MPSPEDEVVFRALDIASDAERVQEMRDEIARAFQSEVEAGIEPDLAGFAEQAIREAGDGTQETEVALRLVYRWILLRDAAQDSRVVAEAQLAAEISRDFVRAMGEAGVETLGDLSRETLDRIVSKRANDAGVSAEVAWTMLERRGGAAD